MASAEEENIDWGDEERLEASLKNVLEQKSLRWVFVGGKGGVGKTTTACSLAVLLCKVRRNVLLISTDPAHNLSDAFSQKFTSTPTAVTGYDNLFGMEIDPSVEIPANDILDNASKDMITELASSVPGIDEAMSFAELMSQVQRMEFDCIVFDTAPTGHTLRLLTFPTLLEKGFAKLLNMKHKFSGIFNQVRGLVGQQLPSETKVLSRLEQAKAAIEVVNKQFKTPTFTTFVCVCIPEFLSLFETERLVQELSKHEIDVHNIVVNQVLVPDEGSECKKCLARVRMQKKYLDQIMDLYEDFHVTVLPLLNEEVRGPRVLDAFGQNLMGKNEDVHRLLGE